ncbi:MAG: exopolysaccharide Pel transporter PelG, partial [Silvanigrellaceae bacterium]|nr:exopolysaccharide Pel transporter PelG [Silvanigrellaceae bacterium]
MAGIGFELRKLTSDNSFLNLLRANLYSSILSSGSWVISISVLVAIFLYLNYHLGPTLFCIQFLVSVSYLVSSSLILSAIFQHCVNRYIADRLFEKQENMVAPALFSSSLLLLILSIVVGWICVEILLYDQLLIIKLLMTGSFVALNLVWLFSNSLTGLKNYKFLVFSFAGSYLLIFILAVNLYQYELIGLLFAFYLGHMLLLTLFFIFTIRNYPCERLFRWEIIDFMKDHKALLFSVVFFQLGVWVDKYCFWIANDTSIPILGSLRASPIYDMPMFVAFVVMIPGLSVFFYEIEANFSRFYHRYFDAIRAGATLFEIDKKHTEVVALARTCFLNVFKIQGMIALFACLFGPEIFKALDLAPVFVYLFRIDVISIWMLAFLISQLNVLYYLDKQNDACITMAILFVGSLLFNIITLYLGPLFYGYGFAAGLICANVYAV